MRAAQHHGEFFESFHLEIFRIIWRASGTPFATQRPTVTVTVSYGSTAEVQVQLNPAGATNATRIDKIALSNRAYTSVFTGKDLSYSVELGEPAWCPPGQAAFLRR